MGIGRNKIDFTRGQVGHIWGLAAAKAVGLLGFLLSKFEMNGAGFASDFIIDFNPIRFGEPEPEFFRLLTDLVVIHGQTRF